jgi:hypothetical protein
MGEAKAKNITAGVREAILIEQFFAPPASPARRRGSDG